MRTILLLLGISMASLYAQDTKGVNEMKVMSTSIYFNTFGQGLLFNPSYGTAEHINQLPLKGKVNRLDFEEEGYMLFDEEGRVKKYVRKKSELDNTILVKINEHDEKGRLIKTIRKPGIFFDEETITYAYDSAGNKGLATTYYDSKKRDSYRFILDDNQVIININECPLKKDVYGRIVNYECNVLKYSGKETNRLIEVISSKKKSTTFTYYPDGKLYEIKGSTSEKNSYETTITYDPNGKWARIVKRTYSNGSLKETDKYICKFIFDAVGNWTKMEVKSTIKYYDAMLEYEDLYNRSITYY